MFAAAPRPWTGTLDKITVHLPTGRATYSTRAAHGHGSNRPLPKLGAPRRAAEHCLLGEARADKGTQEPRGAMEMSRAPTGGGGYAGVHFLVVHRMTTLGTCLSPCV